MYIPINISLSGERGECGDGYMCVHIYLCMCMYTIVSTHLSHVCLVGVDNFIMHSY